MRPMPAPARARGHRRAAFLRCAWLSAESEDGLMHPYARRSRFTFAVMRAIGCFASVLLLLSSEVSAQVPQAPKESTLSSRIRAVMAADGFPSTAIEELVGAFADNADLDQRVQPGDRLALLRDTTASGDILSASLSLPQGPIGRFSYYRFRTSDGRFEFYDDLGLGAARRMQRRPLAGPHATIRAAFGFGRARENKMHTGVDWIAPPGTSIVAAGDGTVSTITWGDEGASISIDHDGGYQTTYSPVAAVAPTLRPGASVAKGERLGRVEADPSGKAGLFHQLIFNSRFHDPLRTRLPSFHRLEGDELAVFRRERDRLRERATDARTYDLLR